MIDIMSICTFDSCNLVFPAIGTLNQNVILLVQFISSLIMSFAGAAEMIGCSSSRLSASDSS